MNLQEMANTDCSKKIIAELKIISINVNSIVTNQRRLSLANMLKANNPDIVFLSETKLKVNHVINFQEYIMIRNDRKNRMGGGTAILIKRNIEFKKVNIQLQQCESLIEYTIIKIKIKANTHLILIAVYAPCGNQKEFIPELDLLFQRLQLEKEQNYYIIAGDLNAKHTSWSNPGNNPRGISLNRWLSINEFKYRSKLYSTLTPSYPFGESFLDTVIADVRLVFKNAVNSFKLHCIPYDSDHNALIANVVLESDTHIPLTNATRQHMYNYKKVDWNKFREACKQNLNCNVPHNRNLTIEETILFLKEMDNTIKKAMATVIPKVKAKDSVDAYTNKTIKNLQKFKSHILTQIHRKQRDWTNDKDSAIKILKKLLSEVRSRLKIEFASSVNKYWEEKIKNIPINNSASMFPQINSIFRKKGKAEIGNLKITRDKIHILSDYNIKIDNLITNEKDELLINNDEDKLNVIGAFLANINNGNETENNRFSEYIESKAREFLNNMNDRRDITLCTFSEENPANDPSITEKPQEYFTNSSCLIKKFQNLNNKKSTGTDGIPNVVLKQIPTSMIHIYATLFNNLLNHRHYPMHWKKAAVAPILKKDKDDANPTSYRPISLLPNISKIFEMVINDALLFECSRNNILPENQFGFRAKHSTLHAINKLTSDVCWAMNGKKCVGACLIDLEKAFDSIWIDGLIFKLIKKGLQVHMVEIIINMIKNRSFVIQLGTNVSSVEFKILNGLQQGTVNAPILFNIYTSDVLKLFDMNSTYPTKAIAFADDLIIYCEDAWPTRIQSTLQDRFDRILAYYKAWKLKINTKKCETILFRQNLDYANKNVRKNYKTFAIIGNKERNEIMPHRTCVKYLGVNIDEKLKFNTHIETQLNKAKKIFFKFKRLFYSKILNEKIKIICYQLLVRPIITYGCSVWYNISTSQMEKIRVFERKCLKVCLRMFANPAYDYQRHYSNKKIYDKANIRRIDNFILKLVRDHFANAAKIKQNSLIFAALYPNPEYFARTLQTGFIPPEAFLYLDANGFIQDPKGIPIIYHVPRHKNIKKITYPANIDLAKDEILLRFCIDIPERDEQDKHRLNPKYWWLHEQ